MYHIGKLQSVLDGTMIWTQIWTLVFDRQWGNHGLFIYQDSNWLSRQQLAGPHAGHHDYFLNGMGHIKIPYMQYLWISKEKYTLQFTLKCWVDLSASQCNSLKSFCKEAQCLMHYNVKLCCVYLKTHPFIKKDGRLAPHFLTKHRRSEAISFGLTKY